MITNNNETVYVYHEKQVGGLCAVHCLNTLFQAPIFTEVDLALLARELDEEERKVMAANGHDTKDFLKYMSEESINVSETGDFSIQVLTKALLSRGLDCKPLGSNNFEYVSTHLDDQQAFIFNKGDHWYTVRKVNGKHWFNFNSTLPQPRYMTDIYLSCEMEDLVLQGYSIYVVVGQLSQLESDGTSQSSVDGRWLRVRVGIEPDSPENSEEFQIRAALRQSMMEKSAIVREYKQFAKDTVAGMQYFTASTAAALQKTAQDENALGSFVLSPSSLVEKPNPLLSTSSIITNTTTTTDNNTNSIVDLANNQTNTNNNNNNTANPTIELLQDIFSPSTSISNTIVSSPPVTTPSILPPVYNNNVNMNTIQNSTPPTYNDTTKNAAVVGTNQPLPNLNDQMALMQRYFEQCLATMERLENRLGTLESNIKKVAENQKRKKSQNE